MESQTPKLYSTTLLDPLKDVTDKCFIFRAYKSPDGSVENATRTSTAVAWKFCKWHVGSRSNKVKHAPYAAPVTSS